MTTLIKSQRAVTVTINSLGILLGALHIILGLVALTPLINQDYHREMKINYSAFAKSLLNIYEFTDRARLALYLRLVMSSLQAVFGAMLIANGHFGISGKVGNYGLLILDAVLFCFQLSVGSTNERLIPTIVFSILLVARIIIVEQSSKTARPGVKTRPNRNKITPRKNKNE